MGRATRYLSRDAGVRTALRGAALDGKVDIDFGTVAGRAAPASLSFSNEFEKTTAQALAGAQLRIPGARIETAADGSSSAVGVSVGYGWYR